MLNQNNSDKGCFKNSKIMKPVKNLFNGFRNKKEFKNSKEKREIIEATINQEPRKVILKKSGHNNGYPPDFGGNGAFF